METIEGVTGELAALRESIAAAAVADRPAQVFACSTCEDSGMVFRVDNGRRVAARCACLLQRIVARRLERAGIPRRYQTASLAEFKTAGRDPSIGLAALLARRLIEAWPTTSAECRGMLLAGNCGVGKTHLAVSILRDLVERGATGRFWDVGDLLLQLKRSFGPDGDSGRTEGSLFEEVSGVDVLVLDELGAQRTTEWSYDEIGLILGARYNANRLTVVTTNFPNLGPGAMPRSAGETLGDRIGARIHSRLQEMCRPVEMVGSDFRMRRPL